jgi:hypothetical protein
LARHISQGTPVFLDYDQLELDGKTKDRPASLPMPSKSPAFRLRATEELSAELRWLARA